MRRIKLYTLSETETIQLYIKKNIYRERASANKVYKSSFKWKFLLHTYFCVSLFFNFMTVY